MAPTAILARIAANPHLPTPAPVALQALQLANQPNCTMRELGKIIACDPGLCGRLLKLVNSSLLGTGRAVTSIDRALSLLGLKRLRSLVLGLSLPALRLRSATAARVKDYWKESVARAIVAREIAIRLRWEDPDTEMIAGLMCDLGALLLQETFPAEYGNILMQPPEIFARSQCELESAAIGVDHADVSAHVLRLWGLPDELTEAIRYHHAPGRQPGPKNDRAYLLYFATRIAQLQVTMTRSSILEEISVLANDRYGMDGMQLVQFLDVLHTGVKEFAALIDVDVGPCENFRELYSAAMENLTRFAVEMSMDLLNVEEEKSQVEVGLKQAEEALRQKDAQLFHAQKMEAVGRLAGGVAHDFNNALTIVLGYCELLLGVMPKQDATRGPIEQMQKAGEKAASLTRQLLAFSRKQVLVPEVFNLNDEVAGMVKMLRRIIGKDIEFVTRLSSTLPLIKADPGQVEQIIMNLAVNARDAMPRGGQLILETISVDGSGAVPLPPELRPGPHVLLIVSDTGTGMDATTLAHLFEPFFTTKERGRGTGLGLATIYGIVKQAGGHIEVESALGRGSTFRIYLPVTPDAVPTARSAGRPDEAFRGSETILLAEDEQDIRAIARRTLEMHGYTILEAPDGINAADVSAQYGGPIHLLIADTILPQRNGYDLAYQLSHERPGLKVLFTSGFTDDHILTGSGPAAGAHFLQKPFTPKSLAAKIRTIFE